MNNNSKYNTPLDNSVSNGKIVRVGGNEGDYKVITK